MRNIPTETLIAELRQAASVWLKNDDLLKLEEIFRRLLEVEKQLCVCFATGIQDDTPNFLDWIADRLIYVYKENPNVDYIQSLRNRAKVMKEALKDSKKL